MKQFRALIVALLIIALAWTVHYVQLASAKNDDTVATIQTISGDEQLLHDVFIEGAFDNYYNYSPFIIRDGVIEPQASSPMFTRPTPQLFQQLMAEETSFMRGKQQNPQQFYKDQANDVLLYVNTESQYSDSVITISGERLQAGKSTTFSVEAPVDGNMSWATTIRSTLQGDTLYTFISVRYDNDTERLYKATIQLEEQKLVTFESVFEAASTDRVHRFITSANDPLSIDSNQYIAYMTGEQHYDENQENPTVAAQAVHVFNAVTNETATIALGDDFAFDERRIVVQNEFLLMTSIHEGQLHVERYNLDTKKWLSPMAITAPTDILPQAYFSMTLANDLVYALANTEDGQIIVVLDAATGEVGYLGAIESKLQSMMLNMTYVTAK